MDKATLGFVAKHKNKLQGMGGQERRRARLSRLRSNQSAMKVTFADFGPSLASSRLRAQIPQKELAKLGIEKGTDVLIYSKHWLSDEEIQPFKKRVFDVCDDHFHNAHGEYYRRHIALADAVTCNSETMRCVIKAETGRDAVVIPEPYESPELPAGIAPTLFWYGHQSNLRDLQRIAFELKYPLLVMSNYEGLVQWSQPNFMKAMSQPCIVIIPTGKSMAKSENRMVEAIRCGKYVCAEYLPTYQPFTKFFPSGSIPEQIESALANPLAAIAMIKAAQEFIRERYSPASIAGQWLEVIRNVNSDIRRVANSGHNLVTS